MRFPTALPPSRLPDPRRVPALRWGIAGPGWIAEHFVRALKLHTAQIVTAIESREYGRARAFADKLDLPKAYAGDMMADAEIDIVYVATPHNFHLPVAMSAIEAGKHVLVEKPLGLNASEVMQLAAAARRKGVFLMEAYWSDFLPKFDVLRQLLADQVLGSIRTVLADHGEHFGPEHRIMRLDLAGGPLLDLGTYPIAFATRILGRPERILALGEQAPSGVNGQASMLLSHAGGAQSMLHTSILGNTPGNATISGTEGMLTIPGPFYTPGPFILTDNDLRTTLVFEEERNRYTQLSHEAAHVALCIHDGLAESPIRPLSETLLTIETVDAVRQQLGIVFNEER